MAHQGRLAGEASEAGLGLGEVSGGLPSGTEFQEAPKSTTIMINDILMQYFENKN